MNLYTISESYQELLDLIEMGEIPEEAIADTLEAVEGEFVDKVDSIACCIKAKKAEIEAIKAEAKKLTDRVSTKQNAVDRLEKYLFDTMVKLDKKKVETPRNVISVRNKAPSVHIPNELDFINWAKKRKPELLDFKDPTPSKKRIGAYIKEQIALNPKWKNDKFELVGGQSLTIK